MVNSYFTTSLDEALKIKNTKPVTPYAGGTDLMIEADDQASYLFLNKIAELKQITEDEEYIRIGACSTYSEVLHHKLIPQILKDAVIELAAPAIRNLGTVGGNVCNGSPKGDSVLIFFVTDSLLHLQSMSGERFIPIKEFYLGRKKLAIREDELLVEILVPKNGIDNYYYEKIGARNALAISRVSFAGILNTEDGRIKNCATAFGAVSDVVVRRPDIDQMMIGKTIDEAKGIKEKYLAAYDEAIVPIRGRVSAEYRKSVCQNLLQDFLETNGI